MTHYNVRRDVAPREYSLVILYRDNDSGVLFHTTDVVMLPSWIATDYLLSSGKTIAYHRKKDYEDIVSISVYMILGDMSEERIAREFV